MGNATSSSIDRIAWGTQPVRNAASSTVAGLPANVAAADLTTDKSYERKATTSVTAASMAPGGFDATRGNGHDLKDNRIDNDGNFTDAGDFVEQSTANPQNSMSPTELPFTTGFVDMQGLQVQGSFPGPNQMQVPPDMTFIGFLTFVDEPKKIVDFIDSWKKDKKLPKEVMSSVLNTILSRCNVEAMLLSREVNLPPPIPLPKVTVK